MADESEEVSVASAFCVVYVLKDAQWVVISDGWAQIVLYRDPTDNTHRVVGWATEPSADQQVVLNCNVNEKCKYKVKSDDFHKFDDDEGASYGFGFYKKEEALLESQAFMDEVLKAINVAGGGLDVSRAPSSASSPISPIPTYPLPSAGGASSPASKSILSAQADQPKKGKHSRMISIAPPSAAQLQSSSHPVYHNNMVPLGQLRILPPRRQEGKSPAHLPKKKPKVDGSVDITAAYGIVHTHHVKFDSKTNKFEGLPPEWEKQLHRQFGLDYALLDKVPVDGYKSKLPSVLVLMKRYLVEHEGLLQEGVFRVAPDQDECISVKADLDSGKFKGCRDIHCMSNLIKVWFRELPRHVLDGVDAESIRTCDSQERAGVILESIDEPKQSLLLWLIDLCIDVSNESAVNKMTPQNLAIVIGPNLFTPPSHSDPLVSLNFSQKVASFLQNAILWRLGAK